MQNTAQPAILSAYSSPLFYAGYLGFIQITTTTQSSYALLAGIRKYVKKPVSTKMLSKMVRQVIDEG